MVGLSSHFLLNCEVLDSIRQLILGDIKCRLRHSDIDLNDQDMLLQIIIDCSVFVVRQLKEKYLAANSIWTLHGFCRPGEGV